jgi:four helix bundle protein
LQDFRKLQVWHKGHALVLDAYRATGSFPVQEQYGLTSQIRRAAGSIPANIAEGCGRDGDAELARFCLIAMGSASELDYHLLLARDLGFLDKAAHLQLAGQVSEVMRMLAPLINSLRRKRGRPTDRNRPNGLTD